ncbi:MULTISPECIES: DUF1488 family protein [unclassified Bradyrhizobium]|jgi:hypothetical protein|uniref:DUF1488 family protein n=1 Tax=unclassified Bradyrhizobium TaxID=2631580 RepID=UPI0002AADD8D|nr:MULTISPECIES: DUF1488 family protein [unclassified Bradyrhizobium]AMA60945.1 hypothetical protein BCCGELA001_35250 [Bradyrhizobium sp. CCGE-LA001]KYH02896.1 hypothetical protein SE91_34470 [Bradyrhizobium sp. DOA1]
MPLTTDPSRDIEFRLFEGIAFAMFDSEQRVLCFVTWAALLDRAAKDGTRQTDARGTFEQYRWKIELIASRNYDQGETRPVVRTEQLTPR